MNTFRILLSGSLGLLVACAGADRSTAPAPSTAVIFVNGAVGSGGAGATLLVDGSPAGTVAFGGQSTLAIGAGAHTIQVRLPGGDTSASHAIVVADGTRRLVVAAAPASGPQALDYGDTNAIVPAGASKLRVVHAAALAPAVTVRRTQPGFDTLITVMFPFPYGASSGYIQGTPGNWSIVVSHENQADTLVATGAVAIPDGHSRTVVLLDDGAGGVTATVVDP